MEICQHCGMYMKPFIKELLVECEFCGQTIVIKVDGKWEKISTVKIVTKVEEIKTDTPPIKGINV